MALETLKDTKEIGGFKVGDFDELIRMTKDELPLAELNEWVFDYPILINHFENEITFRIQNGPIKEVGINGCQVDTIIHAAKKILEGLDAKFPSEHNKLAINKLDMALAHLEQRTKDREQRGVEGTSNA